MPQAQLQREASALDLEGGRRVVLQSLCGCGSRTVVYRAALEAYETSRPVAVKLFDGVSSEERPAFEHRLAATAQRAACVVHENVVATYDHCAAGAGAPFVVTELVDGVSLERCLAARDGPLPIELALLVAMRAADALAAAWSGTHPDGKPIALAHGAFTARDVFLTKSGAIKVGDFGLDATGWESSAVRTIDALSPRLASMAPEIAAGRSPNASSDVFSLGVLLRELLAGPRFAGCESVADAMRDVQAGIVRENPFAMTMLAKPLRALLRCATDPDPLQRFPNAHAFATTLARIERPLGVRDDKALVARFARGEA
jgi:serine/threonine-protein kinase